MAATISWLDASQEEQRRVREIVRLFSNRETQDEMGGRRIVVAVSDALFPGTSVLHSRARYLIFIPWFIQRSTTSKHPLRRMEGFERAMIQAFLDADSVPDEDRTEGLIGNRAGPKVKQLPSTAYWTALEKWGILEWPGNLAATIERSRRLRTSYTSDELDELADRSERVWHHGLEPLLSEIPREFPADDIAGGFRLTEAEASWLRERWLDRAAGSMLAHLATSDQLTSAAHPWDEFRCHTASTTNRELLDDAHRFALAIQGAQLLYALMVGERYQERGYDRVDLDLDEYRDAIDDWAVSVTDAESLFTGWQPSSFWDQLTARGAAIDPFTTTFFTSWFQVVRSGDLDIADDEKLRDAVANRELRTKVRAGRLHNDGLLASWLGGTPGVTVFRWPQVSRLVNDVLTGLGVSDAGS